MSKLTSTLADPGDMALVQQGGLAVNTVFEGPVIRLVVNELGIASSSSRRSPRQAL